MKTIKQHSGKVTQPILIIIVIAVLALIAAALMWSSKKKSATQSEDGKAEAVEGEAKSAAEGGEAGHDDEGLELSAQQMTEQGLKIATAAIGDVEQSNGFPAKLVVNTDRQAHVSPSFSGRVESVNVDLGQQVKKGQTLATLLVPDLVDQQSNLQIAQSALSLAKQDYEREKTLWSQGVSAKQDYQRAYNAYQQAQIQVQASRSRLSAFGVGVGSSGRYTLTAPISGVVSQKDVVVGENVQLASQLFVIDQLDQLWLEFIVPGDYLNRISPNQSLDFTSMQTGNQFKAQVQTLSSEADAQTGRLQVRARVLSQAPELRPNLMVNIQLRQADQAQVMRVAKEAVQQVEGKDVVFLVKEHGKNFEFTPQPVELGRRSSDGAWIEVKSGLKAGQRYISQGSFLLKSEMEKGEAAHGH
ncbi:cobalt-zinc-cadmium efflux system membrane fusion protein [Acinetobacter calcoaceticus]|uniref:Cobalt-zinc-cadmium efflux system membrane fusion protein n=1 Tax=Acinetobacter calcoaceticus TaxID=471 RepID=A0A4R1XWV4_ACICA|nr:cobalt-zinc-cadmium efflux system membrane fusion protein [Acinetobacter calcoaceticus]